MRGGAPNERVAWGIVAAVLAVAAIWLAVGAAGGGTVANAGRVQFYPGPVCRFTGEEVNPEECPRRPARARRPTAR